MKNLKYILFVALYIGRVIVASSGSLQKSHSSNQIDQLKYGVATSADLFIKSHVTRPIQYQSVRPQRLRKFASEPILEVNFFGEIDVKSYVSSIANLDHPYLIDKKNQALNSIRKLKTIARLEQLACDDKLTHKDFEVPSRIALPIIYTPIEQGKAICKPKLGANLQKEYPHEYSEKLLTKPSLHQRSNSLVTSMSLDIEK